MKVLVCGDRKWRDHATIWNVLVSLKGKHGHALQIIEGGAEGADRIAWEAANRLSLDCATYLADWKKYGRAAGPIRNRVMLDQKPDLVLAFHDNLEKSRGTKDWRHRGT